MPDNVSIPILELGDLVPEFRPVRINRKIGQIDGPNSSIGFETQPIILQAYVYGPRCPVLVKAALAQITRKSAQKVQENGGIMSDDIFQEYARDCFMQLIPGISFDEADILASDDDIIGNGKCVQALKYLNYWVFRENRELPEGEEIDPNLKGEDQSTTEKSSPILS